MFFTGTSSPTSLLLFPVICAEFILGVCDQEDFQQAFSLLLPKTFVKIERVLVSSTDRLVAFEPELAFFKKGFKLL